MPNREVASRRASQSRRDFARTSWLTGDHFCPLPRCRAFTMIIGWLSHSKLTENILEFRAARSPRLPYWDHETRFPHSVQSTLNTSRYDTLSQREIRIDVRGKAPREPCHYRSSPVTILRTIPTAPWPSSAHPQNICLELNRLLANVLEH